jgi:hypothetical protein
MIPTLVLMRRWRLPFGSITFLFTTVAVLSSSIDTFELGPTVGAAVIAGLVADRLVDKLRPSPIRPAALRAFGAVVPTVLWLAYFALVSLFFGLGWSVELWAGVAVMAALTGLSLTLLVAPPAMPLAPEPISADKL